MFKIAVVIFRESLEIALLIGIIMAVTKPIQSSRTSIILGGLLGVVLASLFAFFTRTLTNMVDGLGDELFDSCIILLTALIISWTVVWMQGYTKRIQKDVGELSDKISSGRASKFMLVLVVATAIFREGAEILLFIYSISSTESIRVNDYILGLGLGSFFGVLAGTIIYNGLIKFAGKYVFKISTILLILIAAGLASGAAGILTSSGMIETMSEQLWDSSWLIEDRSVTGKLLNIITGYDARPNGMQLLFYFGTILLNIGMMRLRTILIQRKNND
jgi:high-affinity iron transporter